MTAGKRLLDLVLALLLGLLLLPVLIALLTALTLSEGRPLCYISERMRSPTRSFSHAHPCAVTWRITPIFTVPYCKAAPASPALLALCSTPMRSIFWRPAPRRKKPMRSIGGAVYLPRHG